MREIWDASAMRDKFAERIEREQAAKSVDDSMRTATGVMLLLGDTPTLRMLFDAQRVLEALGVHGVDVRSEDVPMLLVLYSEHIWQLYEQAMKLAQDGMRLQPSICVWRDGDNPA